MNYKTMEQVMRLFDALPNFKNYGYYSEPVVDVKFDEGKIDEVHFPMGKLYRSTAQVNGIGYDGREVTWLLGYDNHVTGIFVANADQCDEGKLPHES